MKKIGIIRESRSDDKRTPLIPAHIKEKLDLYLNFNIYDKIRISTELTRELQENSIGSWTLGM